MISVFILVQFPRDFFEGNNNFMSFLLLLLLRSSIGIISKLGEMLTSGVDKPSVQLQNDDKVHINFQFSLINSVARLFCHAMSRCQSRACLHVITYIHTQSCMFVLFRVPRKREWHRRSGISLPVSLR